MSTQADPALRAIRRHHRDRMKAKARRLYPDVTVPQRFADNLTACSCPSCRPRRATSGRAGQSTRDELLVADHKEGAR